jgi:RNA polymerase sigma-70 factor (ECF subfamily)
MTKTSAPTLTLERLLADAAWTRRLALRLVGDEDDADDVVQETWISALRNPPEAARPPRPWLLAVLRNTWSKRLRMASRRRAREEVVLIDAEGPCSPEQLLARVEVHRLLVNAVTELDEPFRQSILLRYFEGKPAVEIAAALGVPAGTIRWRLKAAIDRLRVALDARLGDRARWKAVLAPLALAAREAPRAIRPGRVAIVAAGAVSLVAAVVLFLSTSFPRAANGDGPGSRGPGRARSGVNVSPRTQSSRPPGAPPTFTPAEGSTASAGRTRRSGGLALDDCRGEVNRLRSEAASLGSRLTGVEPSTLFERGEANETAEAVLGPILAAILKEAVDEVPAHRLECRTWVCRLTLLQTIEQRAQMGRWAKVLPRHPDVTARSARVTVGGADRVIDSLSGEELRRAVVHVTLADPSARPVLAGVRGGRPAPVPGAAASSVPATREACESELALLRRAVAHERDSRDLEAQRWLQKLADDFAASDAAARCHDRHPATGELVIRYRMLPARRDRSLPRGGAIAAQYAGALAGTPFGTCVAAEVDRAVLSADPPPDLSADVTAGSRLAFPRP